MPYVDAVLLESQRFMHVTPVTGPRRVLKDTELGGYYIPKAVSYTHLDVYKRQAYRSC